DDGSLSPFAQARADFNAVHVGQAQIENDDVGRVRRGQRESFLAAIRNGDFKSFFRKDGAQSAQDLRFIINHENVRLVGHVVSGSTGNWGGGAPSHLRGRVKLKAKPSGKFSAQISPPCT